MSRRCAAADCFNSSANNRNVQFFGFPKSEEAYKWAENAGRSDLKDKPLDNLNKYYLCGDHFTADSYLDPDTKTRLKKRTRPPQNYPIPTIFKSNFSQFVPNNLKDSCSVTTTTTRVTESEELMGKNPVKRRKNLQSQYVALDKVYMVVENPSLPQVFINDESHAYGQMENQEEEDEDDEIIVILCRLCTAEVADEKDILPIFEESGEVFNIIDQVLPNFVHKNDGKPQNVCVNCYTRAKNCVDTIYEFQENQLKFE